MSESITKDFIEQIDDSQVIMVSVPEWKCHVYLKSLSSYDCDKYLESINNGKTQNLDNVRARLVALCLCAEDGTPVFDSPAKGAMILGKKNSTVIKRLCDQCRYMNGMTEESIEDKKGNSNGDQPNCLPSD